MTRGAVLLTLGLLSAACGGRDPVYRWRDGTRLSASLRVREELIPHRVARAVDVTLRGTVTNGSAAEFEIVRVHHERTRDGRPWGEAIDTDRVGRPPDGRTEEDSAAARVAEALVGRKVRAEFDPEDGLTRLDGMDAALAAAATASDAGAADFRDGIVSLVSDAALTRGARGAGLTAPPHDFRDRSEVLERIGGIFAPGLGVLPCRLLGTAGFDHDGSPVVKSNGRVRAGAVPTGEPGPEPPDEVGPVIPDQCDADAEVQHDLATALPLRGRFTSRVRFGSGVQVVTTTSFTFVVQP